MGVGQGLEQRPMFGAQGALLGEEVGQGLARRGGPDGEGRDELIAVDHPVLERQQTEEQVAGRVIASWHRLDSRPLAAGVATCVEAQSNVVTDTARRGQRS